MKLLSKTIGASLLLVMLLGVTSLAEETSQSELTPSEDSSISSYETYVSLSPKSKTLYGSSSPAYWTSSHGGGTGVYNITFYYGDGSQSSRTNYTSTRADFSTTFSLGSYQTKESWTQTVSVVSSNSATDTANTTLKRYR